MKTEHLAMQPYADLLQSKSLKWGLAEIQRKADSARWLKYPEMQDSLPPSLSLSPLSDLEYWICCLLLLTSSTLQLEKLQIKFHYKRIQTLNITCLTVIICEPNVDKQFFSFVVPMMVKLLFFTDGRRAFVFAW